ncbi:hypothetical protein VTK26DRAFT_2244 [Humicola hyalothermophila]
MPHHPRHGKPGTDARNRYTTGTSHNPQLQNRHRPQSSKHDRPTAPNARAQSKQIRTPETSWLEPATDASGPSSSDVWGAPCSRAFDPAIQPPPTPLCSAAPSPRIQRKGIVDISNYSQHQQSVPAETEAAGTQVGAPGRQSHGINGHLTRTKKPCHDISSQKNKDLTPAPINRFSPNLTAHRIPRPDNNYAGSFYSLPPSVSELNISDTGLAPTTRGLGDRSTTDIRSNIGLKPNIHQSGNTWHTYNWAHPQGKDDDETLHSGSYLGAFICAWRDAIPGGLLVDFNKQNAVDHWKCDINTDKGSLQPPVDYPDTMASLVRLNQELEWHRLNWTSSLLIRRRMGNLHGKQTPHRSRRVDWYSTPGAGETAVEATEYVNPRDIVEIHEHKLEIPEFNHFVSRVPCFLRPAEKYDMEAVRLIYNWEVEHGLQAIESQPLSVEDFEKILSTTQELGMPFLVAVRGSAREMGLTKGNLSYSIYRQIPKDETDPQGQKRGEILGFAFLSV